MKYADLESLVYLIIIVNCFYKYHSYPRSFKTISAHSAVFSVHPKKTVC